MVSDLFLQRISFIITIIGIILLFFIVQNIEPEKIMIKDIDESIIGSYVSVSGIVKSVKITENVFFSLCDSDSCIKAVVFEKIAKKKPEAYNLRNMDKVVLSGRINLYNNELEIIAEDIKILSTNA